MDRRIWCILLFVIIPASIKAWKISEDRREGREYQKGMHYHSKRRASYDVQTKRRFTTQRSRELRKKPSGHLKPLDEDEIENDEVVSVAISPAQIPKFDKNSRKPASRTPNNTASASPAFDASNLIKSVLIQLGRDFLTTQVDENFVFGQYIGNSMKNLTSELRLKMQHEVLETVIKYQMINRGELNRTDDKPVGKPIKIEKKSVNNETEEVWPDFSNIANIVV